MSVLDKSGQLPDKRPKDVPHCLDEPGWVNEVQCFQVLLVPCIAHPHVSAQLCYNYSIKTTTISETIKQLDSLL